METHHICGAREERINPGSLDLAITDIAYRIDEVFIPRPGEPMADLLENVAASPHDLSQPLERGVTYLIKLKEKPTLPEQVYGYVNPKSSTGRNDIHVRVVAEGVPRFDSIPPGFAGHLWIIVTPLSFPVKLSSGETLSQLRLFNQDTRFSELDLQIALERDKLLWSLDKALLTYRDLGISDRDGSLIMTVDISQTFVGWECISPGRVLDFSLRAHYDPHEFFRPLESRNGRVRLRQNSFYILRTRERLRVPPHLSCEVVPMDERSGEFRSHYAGFIDPGWGWGMKGEGIGRPIVLELRPFFQDLVLRDGQPVAKMRFEHLAAEPERTYDQMMTSNYTRESPLPALSKHFLMPHLA